MRRAVVAVIVGGFAFGGIGTGLGLHPGILGVSLTADVRPAITNAGPDPAGSGVSKALSVPASKTGKASKASKKASKKASSKTGEKTISYGGLKVSVPARWPVYWLNKDPNQCVRFDQNAVYVGTPGVNQECPAGLVGRHDTISIAGPAAGNAPLEAGRLALTEGKPAAALAPGTIVRDPSLHEFAVAMPAASPSVDATYGTDPALVERALATIRQVNPRSAPLGRPKKVWTESGWPILTGNSFPAPVPTPTSTPKPTPTPTRTS